jgi:hypothetical protein
VLLLLLKWISCWCSTTRASSTYCRPCSFLLLLLLLLLQDLLQQLLLAH